MLYKFPSIDLKEFSSATSKRNLDMLPPQSCHRGKEKSLKLLSQHVTVVLVRMLVKYDQDLQNCLANKKRENVLQFQLNPTSEGGIKV